MPKEGQNNLPLLTPLLPSMRRVVRAGWRDPEDSDEEELLAAPARGSAPVFGADPTFRTFEEMAVESPEAPSQVASAISRLRHYKKHCGAGIVLTLLFVVTHSSRAGSSAAQARRLSTSGNDVSEWKIGATKAPPPPPIPPENCWLPCGGSGACPGYCGVGHACCMLAVDSDAECPDSMPRTSYHICVKADPVSPPPPPELVARTATAVARAPVRPPAPRNCWMPCGGSGLCPGFCGHGRACCMRGFADDADSCPDDKLLPRLSYHTCAVAVPPSPLSPPPPPKVLSPPPTPRSRVEQRPAGGAVAKPAVAVASKPPHNCWLKCGGSGTCPEFCGAGMACCMMGFGDDDDTCPDVMPKFAYHTCVRAEPPSPPPPKQAVVAPKPAVVAPKPAVAAQKPAAPKPPPNCWMSCNGSGPCPKFCGAGKACCMMGWEKDDDTCPDVMPRYSFHTCVNAEPTAPTARPAVAPLAK